MSALEDPTAIRIPLHDGTSVTGLVYRPEAASVGATLLLAHGAGANQQSAFMTGFARAFSALGVETVTFNFPYAEGRRRMPDRGPVLEACYVAAIETIRRVTEHATKGFFIGGKSMGGRIATQVAAADGALPLDGLVLLGYPLHPPGRPAERRDRHLSAVGRPMLFVQGAHDAFGTAAELTAVVAGLQPAATLHVVAGGDHSFNVKKGDRTNQRAAIEGVEQAVVTWIQNVGL